MGASISASAVPALAGGPAGAARVRAFADAAMTALAETAATRPGPVPGGGPATVAAALATALGEAGLLPERGVGEARALDELTRVLAAGSVDPGHPWCTAHLHGPVLAVAAAADLVGSVLNPSMDS